MKNILNTCLAFCIICISFFESCTKGEQGVIGEKGISGSTIISGNGIPSFSKGIAGDFFIDTVGKVLWGPKNTANWGAGIALVGAQGLPGKSTLSGTVAPPATIGSIGDFYINTSTSSLYGPKTAAGWGAPTFLIGQTGATGATGATGNNGTPAQVIYSPWVTSPYPSRDTTIDGTCVKVRHINAPSLSTAILNQGVMLTYLKAGTLEPSLLPYISQAGGAPSVLRCNYSLQKIMLSRYTLNTCRFDGSVAENYPGQPVMVPLPAFLEFRYVLIPGLLSGGRSIAGAANPLENILLPGQSIPVNLTDKSYEDVCRILGIAP